MTSRSKTSLFTRAVGAVASRLLFRNNRFASDHDSSLRIFRIVALLVTCFCAFAEPSRVAGLEVRVLGPDRLVLGPGGLPDSAEFISDPDFTRTHAWFATSNGVVRLSEATLRIEHACQDELQLPTNAGQQYSIAARDEQSAFVGTTRGGLFRVDFGRRGPRCQQLHADLIKGVFSLLYRPGSLLIGAEDGLWRLSDTPDYLAQLWKLDSSVLNTVTDIEMSDEGDIFAVSRGGEAWIAQGETPVRTVPAPPSVEARQNSRLVFDPHRNLLFVLGVSEQAMRAVLIPLDDHSARQTVGTAVADVYHDEDQLLLLDEGVLSFRWDTRERKLIPVQDRLTESLAHAACTGRQDAESGEINGLRVVRGEKWLLKPNCLLRFTQGINGVFNSRTPERFGIFQSNAPPWHDMAVDHQGRVWIRGSGEGLVNYVHLIDPELQLVYTEPRLRLLGAHLTLKNFWKLGQVSLKRGRRTIRLLKPRTVFASIERSDGTWQNWSQGRDLREDLLFNPVKLVNFKISLTDDPKAMETSSIPVTESVLVFWGLTVWWIPVLGLIGVAAFLLFPVCSLARRIVNSNWRYFFFVASVLSWLGWGKRHLLRRYIQTIGTGAGRSLPRSFRVCGFPADRNKRVVQIQVGTAEGQDEEYQSLKKFVAVEGRGLKKRLGAWVPVPIKVRDIEDLREGREFIDKFVENNGDLSLKLVKKMFDQHEFIFLVNPEPAPSVDQIQGLSSYFRAARIFLVVSDPFEEFSVYGESAAQQPPSAEAE